MRTKRKRWICSTLHCRERGTPRRDHGSLLACIPRPFRNRTRAKGNVVFPLIPDYARDGHVYKRSYHAVEEVGARARSTAPDSLLRRVCALRACARLLLPRVKLLDKPTIVVGACRVTHGRCGHPLLY